MSRDMATSCPGPGSCGTVAPVWLDMRTLQNLTENLYSVDACVSWGFGDGGFDNFDCCLFTLPVKIKVNQFENGHFSFISIICYIFGQRRLNILFSSILRLQR